MNCLTPLCGTRPFAFVTSSLLVMVVFATGGCVSQRYVDELDLVYRRSQEQILDLRAQIEEQQTELDVLRSALANQDPNLRDKLETAIASHGKLAEALSEAEHRLRSIGASPILDPELDAALIELAKSKPELMSYDPQAGMVKFQSDLTFDLGSDKVHKQAIESLKQLSRILESPIGSRYIVRIEGHTDNVPIGRPATRAQHPTNWHLSVHRAIAVKDVLVRSGVNQTRLGVAGFGENRPIKPNGATGNQINRRVEIYLLRQDTSTTTAKPLSQSVSLPADNNLVASPIVPTKQAINQDSPTPTEIYTK